MRMQSEFMGLSVHILFHKDGMEIYINGRESSLIHEFL